MPAPQASDDWPHTGRVMPWILAAFMAMLWLTPFHAIQLTVSLPFDLYLDRIVLPFIVLFWLLALAAGGPHAPRLRRTPIHVALGVFVGIGFVSVVGRAADLSHALLLDQSIKRLVLLGSYAAMFVIVASVVRRTEVRAFMKYMLGLAIVCSLGILWENSYHFNVFYHWSSQLLGATIFQVPDIDTSGFDDTGRRLTIGPAELGLETVGMLAMALPIALSGILHAEDRRGRMLYGLAVCVLIAASFCTYRKSALVAPVAVILSIAVFRRREIVRLLPLGVVLLGMVHFLAPGAIGGVTGQLTGYRLKTDKTTNHRTGGYDAVRPLVWDNIALGQGYGSYDAYANHILDSQVLTALIETGVLGLAAFILMILSVVRTARPYIRSRERERAPPALIAAAAAFGLLCVCFLYDVMVFPHVPYIFLFLAGFMAVLHGGPAQTEASAHPGGELEAVADLPVRAAEPVAVGAPETHMLLICCFLNEERHLPELLESIVAQTRRPDRLLLVDDGSSDRSAAIARAFAEHHAFASFLQRPRRPGDRDRLAHAAELRAFHWALARVGEPYDLIGKLDADLRLTPATLEHLEGCFRREPALGLVGPYLSEYAPDGRRRRDECPPLHVRGALKLYRRECFEEVEPVPEILGWDTIDEIAARMHGWRSRSEPIPDGDPLHLRPTGLHDGTVRAYRRWGACAWGFGAHPLHVLLGTLRRLPQRPPVVGALSYLLGWASAGLRRAPRADRNVRAFGRDEQLARMRLRRAARVAERARRG